MTPFMPLWTCFMCETQCEDKIVSSRGVMLRHHFLRQSFNPNEECIDIRWPDPMWTDLAKKNWLRVAHIDLFILLYATYSTFLHWLVVISHNLLTCYSFSWAHVTSTWFQLDQTDLTWCWQRQLSALVKNSVKYHLKERPSWYKPGTAMWPSIIWKSKWLKDSTILKDPGSEGPNILVSRYEILMFPTENTDAIVF